MKKNLKESKEAKFRRIAEKRVSKILWELGILGKCGNRVYFEYDEPEVKAIFDTIEKSIADVKAKFQKTLEFKLKGKK